MKAAIKVKNQNTVCRQEQICPDCGRVYRQQMTRRVKCRCSRTGSGEPSGLGWLTQRTVKRTRKMVNRKTA